MGGIVSVLKFKIKNVIAVYIMMELFLQRIAPFPEI